MKAEFFSEAFEKKFFSEALEASLGIIITS